MAKRSVICGILLGLSIGGLGLGVAFGAVTFSSPDINTRRALKTIVAWWLGVQALLDVTIAGLLIFFLHRQRTRSSKTNSVINRLIRGAMQTGLLPTTFAIGGLIAFLASPRTALFVMFIIPIGRTYTITLMDGLNIRAELKDKLLSDDDPKALMTELVWTTPAKSNHHPPATPVTTNIDLSSHALRGSDAPEDNPFSPAGSSKSRQSEERSLKCKSLETPSPVPVVALHFRSQSEVTPGVAVNPFSPSTSNLESV
jgi:hypothetical protein